MKSALTLAVAASVVALVACGKQEAAAPQVAASNEVVVRIGHVGATSGAVTPCFTHASICH